MPDDRISGFIAEVSHNDGHAVVSVRGEIDLATADAFRAALSDAIDGSPRVEVDLRETTFMDCSGLAALVAAHRAHEALVVRNARPTILKIFDVAGVGALLDGRSDGDASPKETGS
jgi:anti-anti-sigma factor